MRILTDVHRLFPVFINTFKIGWKLKKPKLRLDLLASGSSTTGMKDMYTPEDCIKYGKPAPSPCPAWGIRLSRADIIHGSTKEGNQLRRTITSWFTGINKDHKSLENPDCMNWKELSKCHRHLTGPTKESLGDKPQQGVAGIRFSAAVPIKSLYSLPQTLVGIKKWTDPDRLATVWSGPDRGLICRPLKKTGPYSPAPPDRSPVWLQWDWTVQSGLFIAWKWRL